jgi:methionyl-tRNA synthetase
MSKSLGNIIDPYDYIKQFGSDALRYCLMKEINLENDMIFSHDIFIENYNADLANIYGNLVSRTINMVQQYSDGKLLYHPGIDSQINVELKQKGVELIKYVKDCVESFRINELIKTVLNYAKSVNKAIEDTKP